MKQRSSEKPGRRIEPLKEFVWKAYRTGYRWFHSSPPHARWAISSGVDKETESQNSNSYEPLKDEPGLFRAFAAVAPHREEILSFVNQHGLLGGRFTQAWKFRDAKPTPIDARVELLRDWMTEILFMREMVQLWDAVQTHDQKSIRRRIQWTSDDSAVFQSAYHAASVDLPHPWLEEPWLIDLDVEHSALGVRGWVVHPDRDAIETIEYLRSERIETALHFLQLVANKKLIDHRIAGPALQYRGYERLEWRHLPSSLIGALWLQFADAIATNRNFNQCLYCKRWFEVSPDTARRDKHYCSQTCRTRAYRTRRAEARRLYALGATLDELAQKFGSDAATIQGWL